MQWEVAGIDAGRRRERAIVVNAEDPAQARRLGVRAGLTVESVHPVDDPAEPRAAPTRTPATPPAVPTPAPGLPPAAAVQPAAVVPVVAVPGDERITPSARTLRWISLVVGGLGILCATVGAAVIVIPLLTARSRVAGITVGLPFVVAGAFQVMASAAGCLLSAVGLTVRDLARQRSATDTDVARRGPASPVLPAGD